MENPNPFDLNEAIRRWQQDLGASPAFKADNLEELASHHRRLTAQLAARKSTGKTQSVTYWAVQNKAALERYDAMLAEWRPVGAVDLAMLLLANERLSALTA